MKATIIAIGALVVASMPCGDRAAIVERLSSKYGEERVYTGLNSSNQLVETFANPDTGSFSILVTRADGRTCLMEAGEYWDGTPQQAAGEKA